MSSVSAVNNSALQVLRNSVVRSEESQSTPKLNGLVAVANERMSSTDPIVDPVAATTKSKITDALFSTTTSATQTKLALFEKTGEALGVREGDFASADDYRAAVRSAFSHLKLQDDASGTIAAIEQSLGLDKLGISLETVIDAMTDPNGDADKALDAALAKSTQPDTAAGPPASKPLTVTRDDIGIYSRVG